MRISGTFELVLRLLRTSSKLAENLFKILGDAHQVVSRLARALTCSQVLAPQQQKDVALDFIAKM